MIKGTITITLLSDLCVSDGGIYNSAIDTDICHDPYGLPFIPAKRIKGCLRECAQELNDWGESIPVGKIFGAAGNQRGLALIQNAYLCGRDAYLEEIRKNQGHVLYHPQNVLQTFTYLRTQTAVDQETGAADNKSLRVMRVANKGLIFKAQVELRADNNEDGEKVAKEFGKCVQVFRHLGVARTRGFGEIHAEFSYPKADGTGRGGPDCNAEHGPYVEGATRLEYELCLNTPVICKSVNGQEQASLDYIEGPKMLGHVAQLFRDKYEKQYSQLLEWFGEGSLKFSNAYLSVGDKRLFEVPASLFEAKDSRDSRYVDRLCQGGAAQAEGSQGRQLVRMKHCYVSIDEAGSLWRYSVKMEERYHHSRPKDKSVGKAMGENDPDSKFYQISSICAGQRFRGFISGTVSQIKEIYQCLTDENAQDVYLGYGKNGEYGHCSLAVKKVEKVQKEEASASEFFVLLRSPAIVYNSRAMASSDADDLISEAKAAILLEEAGCGDIQCTKYINRVSVGGFNVTWGCRKPTVEAFGKGTVLHFTLPGEKKLRTGTVWIGERTSEGFGEAEVMLEPAGKGNRIILDSGVDNQAAIEIIDWNQGERPLMHKTASRLSREFLKYQAVANAAALYQKIKKAAGSINELKPTVSNMMLMCDENNTLESLETACTKRFSRSSEKKQKKLAVAKMIIAQTRYDCSGSCQEGQSSTEGQDKETAQNIGGLEEKFGKAFQINNYKYEDEVQPETRREGNQENMRNLKMDYLRQLLTEIKYLLRAEEQKGGTGNE